MNVDMNNEHMRRISESAGKHKPPVI
jgi:hypothetical protein